MGKPNHKGRSKGGFVMVIYPMMESPAWLDLSGWAVKLLLHLMKLAKGNNGYGDDKRDRGRLFLSEREAARCIGVSKNTAKRALEELIEHGFLRVMKKGHYDVKGVATTWRLTFQPYPHTGLAPTNDWRQWKPDEQNTQAQNLTSTGSKSDQLSDADAGIGSKTDPISPFEGHPIGSITAPHIDIPQGGSAGGDAQRLKPDPFETSFAGGPFAARVGGAR